LPPNNAEAEETSDSGSRSISHVRRELRQIRAEHLAERADRCANALRAVPVVDVPHRVESERERCDPQTPGLAQPHELDQRHGGKRESQCRARDRERQGNSGYDISLQCSSVECDQHRQSAGDRAEEPDLKRDEQVVPRRAEKQDRCRSDDRKRVADALPRVRKQERDAREVKPEQHETVDPIVAQPDRDEQDLENGDREEMEVAVVGREEDVDAPGSAVDDPAPLVEEEGRAEPLAIDDNRRDSHQQRKRGDSDPCGLY
jgi:hypothetical protein